MGVTCGRRNETSRVESAQAWNKPLFRELSSGYPARMTGDDRCDVLAGAARSAQDEEANWSRARPETAKQRADRNFVELLQEMRVVQTGVQILFGLLVTVAFTARFAQADEVERGCYLLALVSTSVTTALLIAPVAYHRRVFQQGLKRDLVRFANVLVRLGMLALCVAMLSSLFLVLDIVLSRVAALVVLAPILVLFWLLWFAIPARVMRRRPEAHRTHDPGRGQGLDQDRVP